MLKRQQKRQLLYTITATLFLLGCATGTTPPTQALSDARQALFRAEVLVENSKLEADKADYNEAKNKLAQAEEMTKLGRYELAKDLADQSQASTKAIIKRNRADVPVKATNASEGSVQPNSNIKFRY